MTKAKLRAEKAGGAAGRRRSENSYAGDADDDGEDWAQEDNIPWKEESDQAGAESSERESRSEEAEQQQQEEEEEEEEEEEDEVEDGEAPVPSDGFFSWDEMEKFASELERNEVRCKRAACLLPQHSLGILLIHALSFYFQEDEAGIDAIEEEDEDTEERWSDDEFSTAKNMRYEEFWRPPRRKQLQRGSNNASSGSLGLAKESQEVFRRKTTHEKTQGELKEQIRKARICAMHICGLPVSQHKRADFFLIYACCFLQLEAAAMEDKPWSLGGEITGKDRPENSLLEIDAEWDTARRAIPEVGFARRPAALTPWVRVCAPSRANSLSLASTNSGRD